MDVYLAGKMSGLPEHNFPAFDAAREALRAQGIKVRCPAEHTRSIGFDEKTQTALTGMKVSEAFHWDLSQMCDPACDGIALIPGWENSPGANIERNVCKYIGKEVWYYDPETESLIHEHDTKTLAIGLSGYGLVGKDEVGKILVERHGFERRAKGDLIKRAMIQIDPWIPDRPEWNSAFLLSEEMSWYEGDWLTKIDAVKSAWPHARLFMQQLADQMVDVMGGRDIWNERIWEQIEQDKPARVVMTRISLPQEADMLRKHGGYVWRVERPGYGPANSHPNEVALDGYPFDAFLVNDGTIEDLADRVAHALESILPSVAV